MLFSILGLWKARRGRRAAVAAIAPLVEYSRKRVNGIPESVWLDPYIVGFVVMLITLIARRNAGALDTHTMGLVQCEAWSEITGMKPDLIGEEVLHLSTAGNKVFEFGCRNAVVFDQALNDASLCGSEDYYGSQVRIRRTFDLDCSFAEDMPLGEGFNIAALWSDYFDRHLA